VIRRGPERGEPAERDATEVSALDVQAIEQRDQIGAEPVESRRLTWDIGLAVTAAVVADDAEVPRQLLHLRIPEAEIGAERVEEHHHIGRVVAIHPVSDAESVDLGAGGGV